MIAILVITHNRVELLRRCVENVLLRATATSEIVIWDNASADGTSDYLSTLTDPRFSVVSSPENIGMNGYARAFRMTTAPYVVELDDDVVDAPPGWDVRLLEAYERLPEVGFLAADIVDDPYDEPAHYRYRVRPHEYTLSKVNGVPLLEGPAGGGCAMTSRELAVRVGGFPERKGEVFWEEETEYQERIWKLGYRGAVLADLKVHHTGGPHYTVSSPEKLAYWRRYHKRRAQKAAVKRVLLHVPFVPRLNARFGWFQPPQGN
jgi:rhamnopyranosyl-N-acetylglucosaminyl-diphospho-decaprenol beta-1,3/1,4-galactofuranosyltransferase